MVRVAIVFLYAVALTAGQMAALATIPKEAELVCQSARGGEKSEFGPFATEVYVADSGGGHLTRITHDRKLYNHIAVAGNRKMIAAGRLDSGDTNKDGRIDPSDRKTLIVIDLENQREWAPVPQAQDACIGGVDFTPDSRYIVASMRINGAVDIYRVRPDGTGLENLTGNLPKLLGISKPVLLGDVSTSFDGKWIAFTGTVSWGQPFRIMRMRMDGSEAHYVTDGGGVNAKGSGTFSAKVPLFGDFDPEFSPDGQFISFQRSTDAHRAANGHSSCDVMRIKIDGTDLLRLSPAGNQAVHGISDWSADNRIVFSEWNERDRWSGPVIVNPDGSNYHRVEKLKGCTWVRWINAPEKSGL
jgi:Tol biopolymer transport system component